MRSKLVYNIEPASPSMIASLDRHCLNRVPDGSSNIVVARSYLNEVLVGDDRGLLQSLKNLYASGVQRPAKQAEKPYLRIVVSASPEFFRPDDPKAIGTWDDDRLTEWRKTTIDHLLAEFGSDLVFAELHLDEDTPHIHAVVAPTYSKKARKPGRKKRNETEEEFEARKAKAIAANGVRTVGRASHDSLSKKGSFQRLRERMALAVHHLGIDYGEDRSVNAPAGQSTREWVKEQFAEVRKEKGQVASDQEELAQQKAELGNLNMQISQLANELAQKKTTVQRLIDKRNNLRSRLPT
ncbi:plasmid recombination protein [Litoreibacter roseus]|uniref:Plasmid recombination enzyme n=1 Tax=Litoreibacter roseus TaxID=2601869 RepID=A0A6N6JG65_9RHOB|nr:plasmid recombination protein [Litoreibacter roseus]GFE64369.1 hypothetical protein KIN_14430 [Litoreibacter roseus]